jgi:hypothetical protein
MTESSAPFCDDDMFLQEHYRGAMLRWTAEGGCPYMAKGAPLFALFAKGGHYAACGVGWTAKNLRRKVRGSR